MTYSVIRPRDRYVASPTKEAQKEAQRQKRVKRHLQQSIDKCKEVSESLTDQADIVHPALEEIADAFTSIRQVLLDLQWELGWRK